MEKIEPRICSIGKRFKKPEQNSDLNWSREEREREREERWGLKVARRICIYSGGEGGEGTRKGEI